MNGIKKLSQVILIATLFLGLTYCGETTAPDSSETYLNENIIGGSITEADFSKVLSSTTLGELSDEEISGLLFMREEEKLARDVYLTLYNKYNLRAFNNISKSEQVHMNAVKYLLNRYELRDPAESNDIGEFTNEELQTLYNNFITSSEVDEIEALKVGALIEETDIVDLQNHITEVVGNDDIVFVYSNLLRGSTHHLKAFVFNLKVRGIDYEPQILDFITYTNYVTD